jgi:hypothetical protein
VIGEVVCEVIGDATTMKFQLMFAAQCVRTFKNAYTNFEESASIGTSHTAEQYSYEFKVSDQKSPKTPQQKSYFQDKQGRSDNGR